MRRVLTAVVACAAAVLAGCSAPPLPEVTFFADGETVRADPHIYCDVPSKQCDEDRAHVVSLRIRAGKPVQVSVPSGISEGPWGVAFSYVTQDGRRMDASSRIFFPEDNRLAYTLELPTSTDRLLLASVQRLAVVNGDQLLPTGYWTLQGLD
ncbi:MAG: DUF2771 domain-containing protein [Actinomycetota bacterium]|nr:DUF2771 domain-containing protein [Actinomycetota bacterium]